jgi:hypothetical protein
MDVFSYLNDKQIVDSFDFIENFVNNNIRNGKVVPDTDTVVSNFSEAIGKKDKKDFAFLVLHSGYIPDYYESDSSEETLYSKLIEALVCEWSKRIGFKDSYLQKVKSNKEDVTIVKDNNVIVCDAKSFRLGRSQQAPNVKDIIKKAAYVTWLDAYENMTKIGGLVTFPSLHKHKKATEVYQYFTEGNPSIMVLTYEEMAYMLIYSFEDSDITRFLSHYDTIFDHPSRDISIYTNGIKNHLFCKPSTTAYEEFMQNAHEYIKLKVQHAIDVLKQKESGAKLAITEEIQSKTYEELQKFAIETKYQHVCHNIIEKEKNIKKFRLE